jgi:hypothetical protein
MKTQNEAKKIHQDLKINVYDSEVILPNDQKSFYANNKTTNPTFDEKTMEKMNLDELKSTLIQQIKRIKVKK